MHEETADVRIEQSCGENRRFVRLCANELVRKHVEVVWEHEGTCPFERVALVICPVPLEIRERVHVELAGQELFRAFARRERPQNARARWFVWMPCHERIGNLCRRECVCTLFLEYFCIKRLFTAPQMK